MRRLLALSLLLLAPAVLAAVPTTTVNGTVVLPSGSVATGGTISCTLVSGSTPVQGSAMDGGTNVRVAGTATGTISGSGVPTGLALVGNDLITPAGTQYSCKITVSGPIRTAWTEPNWTIASAPSTINIGAISRPGVTSLTISGISGAQNTLVASNGAGAAQQATNITRFNTADADIDGNGTAASADWTGDATADELGTRLTGAFYASRSFSQYAFGTSGATHDSAIAQMWAHALQYGDPNYYTRPAVWDIWEDVFQGHRSQNRAAAGHDPLFAVATCFNGTCSGMDNRICVQGTYAATALDCNGDGTINDAIAGVSATGTGTADFCVGDLLQTSYGNYLSTNRAHIAQAFAQGTGGGTDASPGGNGCITTKVLVTLSDYIDYSSEGITNAGNTYVRGPWSNAYHSTPVTGYYAGYQMGYASRLMDGPQGPDLLANGSAEYGSSTSVSRGWTVSVGTINYFNWPTTGLAAATVGQNCSEGGVASNGANACFYVAGSAAGTFQSANWINVTGGERYVFAGWGYPSVDYTDYWTVVADVNGDGTETELNSVSTPACAACKYLFDNTSSYWQKKFGYMGGRFWFSFEVPTGIQRIKMRFVKTNVNGRYPHFDQMSLRRVTTWANDTAIAQTQYLINDPGSRLIVITGDSWAGTGGFAAGTGGLGGFKNGLIAALNARYAGRDFTSQVVYSGEISAKTSDVLTSSTCSTSPGTWNTGSLNCWYEMVEKFEPAYVVWFIGTNDVLQCTCTSGVCTNEDTIIANMISIAQKTRAIGAIPIFAGLAPVNNTFASNSGNDNFICAHHLRDRMRRVLLNIAP